MLRTWMLAGLMAMLGIVGCNTNDTSRASTALSQSPGAALVLHDLQSKFVHHYETPPSFDKLVKDDETPTAATTSALPTSDVSGVTQNGTRLSFAFQGGPPKAIASAPSSATGAVELTANGATLRFSLNGAKSSAVEEADGYLVYQGAAPSGGHVLHRATREGIEDYVTFDTAPATAAVDYTVTLASGIAGLRLVGGALEFLDSTGAPRLRVRRPFLVGVDGKAVGATLSVVGCAVDTDPRPPWNRAVTPPGAASCMVRASWTNAGVKFPALLDPSWTSTGNMSEARADHTLTVLDDGRVLAACGTSSAPVWPGAELYDPATGTWATTGAPAQKRTDHIAVKLPNGQVLIAGGTYVSGLYSAELYSVSTGTWSPTGNMNAARRVFAAERLSNGKVLVAGGYTGRGILATAELYDPVAGTWSYTGSMSTNRAGHRSSMSSATTVLVTGGTNGTYQASAEKYAESSGTWSSAGSMSTPRALHGQTALAFDGKVLVAGGTSNGNAMSSSVDIYDPSSNSWTAAQGLQSARGRLSAVLLHTAQVVVPGGDTGSGYVSSADLWSTYPQRTNGTTPLVAARGRYAAARLAVPNTQVLVAGGYNGSSYLTSAELYDVANGNVKGSTNPEGWALEPLTLSWDVENPTGSFTAATYSITATLKNNDKVARSAYIDLSATGLDDRTITRSAYLDVTVAAGGSTQLTIPSTAFPIEPVSSEAQLQLSFRPYVVGTGPTGENWSANSPLFYEFSSNYTQVIMHGAIGKDLDRTQPAPSATQAAWMTSTASMRSGLATVTGRVWTDTGGFVDVSTLPPAPHGAHAAYAMRGQWAKDLDTLTLAANYVPPQNAKYYVFCAKWAVQYDDAGYGEDILQVQSVQKPWAARANYLVSGPGNTLVSIGNLEADGCTLPMLLGNSDTFELLWETQMKVGTTTTRVQRGPYGMYCNPDPIYGCSVDTYGYYPDWFVHSITTQNDGTVTPPGAPHYDNHASQETFCTRAAGVIGLALGQSDNGLAANKTYSVYANTGCPSLLDQNQVAGEACGGDVLYLGKSFTYDNQIPPQPLANGRHTSYSKHTIGHEFGHMIASGLYGPGVGLGSPTFFQYDCQDQKNLLNCQQGFADGGIPPTTEPICRCDFVKAGNHVHCLQSKQTQPFANNEGFAHFYSSNLFNNPSESNCTFVYYKTMKSWNSLLNKFVDKDPPAGVSCYTPASSSERWLYDQCPDARTNKGVELDWLRFFWEMHNKTTYAYVFDDINRTFREACTGSTSLPCNGNSVFFDEPPSNANWPNPQSMSLKLAAYALFTNDKASYFRDTAIKYGVNNTP